MSLQAWARAGHEAGGAAWYPSAERLVRSIAKETRYPPGFVADVMALLSPRVPVARNVSMARAYLAGEVEACDLPTIPSVKAALSHYNRTGEIRGPKVSAFARALRGDTRAVVVDTWIFQALNAARPHGIEYPPGGGARYRRAADAVRSLALRLRRIDARPWVYRETQACLWVGYQLHLGRTPAPMALETEG